MGDRTGWKRLKRAAIGKTRNKKRPRGRQMIGGEHSLVLEILQREGLGVSRLRKPRGPLDPNEFTRLKSGNMDWLQPDLLDKLVSGVPQARREAVRREIEEAASTSDAERACLIRARYWRREVVPTKAPDLPFFEPEAGNALTWVSENDLRRVARLDAEFRELQRRVDDVLPSHGVTVDGTDMMAHMEHVERQVLRPLLENWDSSGFTQRHWRELSAQDLYDYMRPRDQFTALAVLQSPKSNLDRIREVLANKGPLAVEWNPENVIDSRWESAFNTVLDS